MSITCKECGNVNMSHMSTCLKCGKSLKESDPEIELAKSRETSSKEPKPKLTQKEENEQFFGITKVHRVIGYILILLSVALIILAFPLKNLPDKPKAPVESSVIIPTRPTLPEGLEVNDIPNYIQNHPEYFGSLLPEDLEDYEIPDDLQIHPEYNNSLREYDSASSQKQTRFDPREGKATVIFFGLLIIVLNGITLLNIFRPSFFWEMKVARLAQGDMVEPSDRYVGVNIVSIYLCLVVNGIYLLGVVNTLLS